MKKTIIILLFILCAPLNAFAFSLVDDWSNITNPNGPWSYNEGNNPLQYNIAGWPTGEFGPAQTAWANSNSVSAEGWNNFLPGWFKSVINPNSIGSNGPYDWEVGDVVVHARGLDGIYGVANVTWTSPYTGIFDIDGGLWMGRNFEQRSNDWFLYLNDVVLASGHIADGDQFSRSNPNSFDFDNLSITQGDVLKLAIVRANGDDFVGVNFNVNDTNSVPEPATMVLFGSGLVGILFRRKKTY